MVKLLLVDDNAIDLEIYSHFLKAAGHEVFTANDGLDGYSKYRQLSPDMVITDIVMKNNGLELLDKIKKDNEAIPVFTMSGGVGNDQGDTLLEVSKEMGADFNFHKPVAATTMLDKINHFFKA